MTKKITLEDILKEADIFWSKFGKLTNFRTKEDYISSVKSSYDQFKAMSKKAQEEYTKQEQVKATVAINNISRKLQNNTKEDSSTGEKLV